MKEIKAFKTSDGRIFETSLMADAHEAYLKSYNAELKSKHFIKENFYKFDLDDSMCFEEVLFTIFLKKGNVTNEFIIEIQKIWDNEMNDETE
jgi:hypothetical protein